MITKKYYFSELFPNQNTVDILYNTPTIISSSFFDLGDDIFIKKARIYMKRASFNSMPYKISLYYQSGNDEVFVDSSASSTLSWSIDFTNYLYAAKSNLSNLALRATLLLNGMKKLDENN